MLLPSLLTGLAGLCAQSDPAAALVSTKPADVIAPPPPAKSPGRPPPAPTGQRPTAPPPGPDAAPPPEPLEPPSLAPPSLEPARLAPASEERAVVPHAAAAPARDDEEDEDEPEPMPETETATAPRTAAELARAAAGTFVPAQRASFAIQLLERTLRSLDPRRLNTSELAQRVRRLPATAPAPSEVGPAKSPLAASAAGKADERAVGAAAEGGMLDLDALDRIRLEIKSRLPYFQACADASRRRGGPDVRRLQAVWSVTADGAIKELKLENVSDAQLALCITRMGSRPFTAKPGTDLTIPTPIVFVR